jgi:lipid-A-disaccharide synthase-like uncharacterized protein
MNWAEWVGVSLAERMWVLVGYVGQAAFSMRFLLQWIASERRRESVIPIAFWFFSLIGSLILLAYALHRRDPVFTIGQSFGLVVYVRNLMLIYRKREAS